MNKSMKPMKTKMVKTPKVVISKSKPVSAKSKMPSVKQAKTMPIKQLGQKLGAKAQEGY